MLGRFEVKEGTTKRLEEIGVEIESKLTNKKYLDMPSSAGVRKWNERHAQFKEEGNGGKKGIREPTVNSLPSILKYIDADYITKEACNALSILDVNDEKDQEEIIEKFIIPRIKKKNPYGDIEVYRGNLLVSIEKIDDEIPIFKLFETPFENDIYIKLDFLKRIYKLLFNEEV